MLGLDVGDVPLSSSSSYRTTNKAPDYIPPVLSSPPPSFLRRSDPLGCVMPHPCDRNTNGWVSQHVGPGPPRYASLWVDAVLKNLTNGLEKQRYARSSQTLTGAYWPPLSVDSKLGCTIVFKAVLPMANNEDETGGRSLPAVPFPARRCARDVATHPQWYKFSRNPSYTTEIESDSSVSFHLGVLAFFCSILFLMGYLGVSANASPLFRMQVVIYLRAGGEKFY